MQDRASASALSQLLSVALPSLGRGGTLPCEHPPPGLTHPWPLFHPLPLHPPHFYFLHFPPLLAHLSAHYRRDKSASHSPCTLQPQLILVSGEVSKVWMRVNTYPLPPGLPDRRCKVGDLQVQPPKPYLESPPPKVWCLGMPPEVDPPIHRVTRRTVHSDSHGHGNGHSQEVSLTPGKGLSVQPLMVAF